MYFQKQFKLSNTETKVNKRSVESILKPNYKLRPKWNAFAYICIYTYNMFVVQFLMKSSFLSF